VVVMSALDGRPLIEYPHAISREMVEELFSDIRGMYRAGVVHADMSEFNVIVSEEGHITLFDFPQWVPPSHSSAEKFLSSDITNLLIFLSKRSAPHPTLPSILGYVKGEEESMEWA
jgi:RIO kinase 2